MSSIHNTKLNSILERLSATDAKTVALQFPEGLKRQAWQFADELKKHGYSVIISGSPCWGACDLDVAALNEADILIHYGHAPVDDTEGVIYEYLTHDIFAGDGGDKRLPTPDEFTALLKEAVSLFGAESPEKIGLVTTIQHVHELPRVAELLKEMNIEGVIAKGGSRTPFAGQILGCSYGAARNTGCGNILFIGTGVFHPTGIALSAGVGGGGTDSKDRTDRPDGKSATVVALDPFMKRVQLINTDKLLRQRFAKIEKARSAERFGIIVSKKSGQRREELARRLLSLSDKAYLVSLGEITPDSLLNLGFDAYVNTSCPRLAYDDQARYPVPMLSPQEFEIVCGVRDWEDYAIDEFDNI